MVFNTPPKRGAEVGERPRDSFFQTGEPAADPSRTASPGPKRLEHNKFSFSGKIQAQSSDLSLFAALKAFSLPLFLTLHSGVRSRTRSLCQPTRELPNLVGFGRNRRQAPDPVQGFLQTPVRVLIFFFALFFFFF